MKTMKKSRFFAIIIVPVLLAASLLMTSFTGFREGEIPLTFILVAVIFLGQQSLHSGL